MSICRRIVLATETSSDALSKLDDVVLTKSFKVIYCLDPIMFKFCYPVTYSLNTELQTEFQTFEVSICNGNKKLSIGSSTFSPMFASKLIMFPLLLLTKEYYL